VVKIYVVAGRKQGGVEVRKEIEIWEVVKIYVVAGRK